MHNEIEVSVVIVGGKARKIERRIGQWETVWKGIIR